MSLFATPPQPTLTRSWTEAEVDIVSLAANHFAKAFYECQDNVAQRLDLLGRFYRPQSTLLWNGSHLTGLQQIGEFLARIPPSHHDVQTVDCHPIAGTNPPRIIITTTGTLYSLPPSSLTSTPVPTSLSSSTSGPPQPDLVYADPVPEHPFQSAAKQKHKAAKRQVPDREMYPRGFVQVFEVGAEGEGGAEGAGLQPKYFIIKDIFRFVG